MLLKVPFCRLPPVSTLAGVLTVMLSLFDSTGLAREALAGSGPAPCDTLFHSPVAYVTGERPFGVEIADLNADGWLDAAVTNLSPAGVQVLLGDGVGGLG